ncbi:MAG: hypothetical protein M3521_00970 [Acidobacteriota bacterium]|nr:hypothetical protein [Acidobacteriota bacterium]
MRKINFIFVCLLFVSFSLAASSNALAQDEVMTNNEVISLAVAGLNKTIIRQLS